MLAPTVAPVALASEPRPFSSALASRRHIAVTAPLTHARRSEAPAGRLVAGVVPGSVVHIPPRGSSGAILPPVEQRIVRPAPARPPESAPVATHVAIEEPEPDRVAVEERPEQPGPAAPPSLEVTKPAALTDLDVAIAAAFERAGVQAPAPGEPAARPRSAEPTAPSPAPAGQRMSLADSRRLGLGPAYHGSLPEAMRAERARLAHSEPVPEGVREVVRDTLGVDVGEKMVHRGPEVSAEARALGAQAFTRDREVFVADEVGELDSAQGRATVAHEMTHLAQQISATVVPDEHTVEGQAQEAAAREVERFVRGDVGAPRPRLLHEQRGHPADLPAEELTDAVRATMRDLVGRGVARDDGRGGIEFVQPAERMVERPPSSAGSAGTQRLTEVAAPTTGPSGRSEASMQAEGFGRNVLGMFRDEALQTMSSVFGFSESFEEEIQAGVDAEDRPVRIAEYQERRLSHLKNKELTQRNEALSAAHRPPIEELPSTRVDQIAEGVHEEVERRVELLRQTEQRAVEQLNENRQAGQERVEHVDREHYEQAFTALFGDPDSDETPTDEEIARMLGAAAERTARQRDDAHRERTAAAGAAGGAAGAGAQMDHVTGGATGGAGGATGTGAGWAGGGMGTGGGGGTTAGRGAPGAATGNSRAGGGAPDTHRTGAASGGQSTAGEAGHDHEVHQWEDPNVGFGRRVGSLGADVAFDVFGEELETFGSVFGFSGSFSKELSGGLAEGRTDALAQIRGTPAATGQAAGGAAGTDAAPGAAAGGAAGTAAAPGDAAAQPGAAVTGSGRVSDTGAQLIDVDHLDMNELANRIYPNLRSMLRQELLIDRERAGLLNDFR